MQPQTDRGVEGAPAAAADETGALARSAEAPFGWVHWHSARTGQTEAIPRGTARGMLAVRLDMTSQWLKTMRFVWNDDAAALAQINGLETWLHARIEDRLSSAEHPERP